METVLDDREARVLGSLIEKELATPDYYPMSLNALTNACNQKSNRDPVVSYAEETVAAVLDGLIAKGLANKSVAGRVPKYEETFLGPRNLVPRESAVLCVLLLRGSQTAGELRARTERMAQFESLEAVLQTLERLQEWGYVERMPRLPGHREQRYAHLLCGTPSADRAAAGADETADNGNAAETGRLEALEQEVDALKRSLEELKTAFEDFKRQFA